MCLTVSRLFVSGPLFGVTGSEQPFSVTSVTSVPSAFPVMAHPAFGLLSPGTARPEFGGLGALGVTAALAAHPQLGAFTGLTFEFLSISVHILLTYRSGLV